MDEIMEIDRELNLRIELLVKLVKEDQNWPLKFWLATCGKVMQAKVQWTHSMCSKRFPEIVTSLFGLLIWMQRYGIVLADQREIVLLSLYNAPT